MELSTPLWNPHPAVITYTTAKTTRIYRVTMLNYDHKRSVSTKQKKTRFGMKQKCKYEFLESALFSIIVIGAYVWKYSLTLSI